MVRWEGLLANQSQNDREKSGLCSEPFETFFSPYYSYGATIAVVKRSKSTLCRLLHGCYPWTFGKMATGFPLPYWMALSSVVVVLKGSTRVYTYAFQATDLVCECYEENGLGRNTWI